MNKIIRFSKFFIPAAVISSIILVLGIAGYVTKGFALGVDFQPGLIQEVRFAPTAFTLRWHGTANARFSFDSSNIYIILTTPGAESRTFTFPFSEYTTIDSLTRAMISQTEVMEVSVSASPNVSSQWLIFSAVGSPDLTSNVPYVVHYLDPSYPAIDIAEVRAALSVIDQGVSVQSIGEAQDRHFMIRVEDKEDGTLRNEIIVQALEEYFGEGEAAVIRSDFVGSRFAKDLTDQVVLLLSLTLVLILGYTAIRFKPQYAVGAVVGIIHDAVVIVAFVVWTRMEFNTTTIAAILTILGYSINNTIVLFDRIRENRRLYPDHSFVEILNISLTVILGRTVITTVTTMLAVLSLFIFTTGSMKDFALALIVGLISGFYTSLFICTGVVLAWENKKNKNEKKKQPAEVKA